MLEWPITRVNSIVKKIYPSCHNLENIYLRLNAYQIEIGKIFRSVKNSHTNIIALVSILCIDLV